jgi:hypothetical protein
MTGLLQKYHTNPAANVDPAIKAAMRKYTTEKTAKLRIWNVPINACSGSALELAKRRLTTFWRLVKLK